MTDLSVICKEHSWGLRHPLNVALGFYRELQRSWYTANRPVVPTATRTIWVDAAAGDDSRTVTQAQNSSTPWKTLGKTVYEIVPGDLVYLKGTFDGAIWLPYYSGTSTAWFQFQNWPGESATIRGASFNNPVVIDESYVYIKGLTLNHYLNSLSCILDNSSHIYIDSCTSYGGFRLNNASDGWYEANIFDDVGTFPDSPELNEADAFFINNGASRNVIYNNTIGTCSHAAIVLGVFTESDSYIYDNRVAFNTINNPWAGGIGSNGYSYRNIVECNDIYNVGTAEGTVAGSKVGIGVISGYDGIYRFNRIYNADEYGISMSAYDLYGIIQHCRNNRIYHNTIYGCGSNPFSINVKGMPSGIDMIMDGNIIENNLAYNNNLSGGGDYNGVGYPLWVSLYWSTLNTWNGWTSGGRTLNGNIVRNNAFANSSSDSSFCLYVGSAEMPAPRTNYTYTISQFNAAFPGCTSNLGGVNPEFISVDSSSPQFLAIPDTSAVTDCGNPITGFSYSGFAPDLGVYEAK